MQILQSRVSFKLNADITYDSIIKIQIIKAILF